MHTPWKIILGRLGCPFDVQVGGGTPKSEHGLCFLGAFGRHLADFGRHLGPSWVPKGSQNPPFLHKISKKVRK